MSTSAVHRPPNRGNSIQRVDRALGLLRRFPVPATLRAFVRRYPVSLRQARRYIEVPQRHPEGVPVPEPTAAFTVKVPVGLARRVRGRARSTGRSVSAFVTRALEDWLERVRPGPRNG